MYFPNFTFKNSLLHLHFDFKRPLQNHFSKAIQTERENTQIAVNLKENIGFLLYF